MSFYAFSTSSPFWLLSQHVNLLRSLPACQKASPNHSLLVFSFIPALLCETNQPLSSPTLTTHSLRSAFQRGPINNTPQNLFLLRTFNDFQIAQSIYHILILLCEGCCTGNALGVCFPYIITLLVPLFIYLTNAYLLCSG